MNMQLTPVPELTTMGRVKRIIVAVAGGTVLALGIALTVLPGPAFIVIPAGLAILAIEFAWARHWLRSIRAILPRASESTAPGRKVTLETIRRSASFLIRQVRRTLQPKKKNA